MKARIARTFVLHMLLLSLCLAEDESPAEELPKPEGWRSRFGNGPSYDPNKAFNSMSENRAANRMGNNYYSSSSSSNSGSYSKTRGGSGSYSSSSGGYSKSDGYSKDQYSDKGSGPAGYGDYDDQFGTYGSASEYGGYGSDSGYGLSCASGYVNASAVALLAFLFLLNIVQRDPHVLLLPYSLGAAARYSMTKYVDCNSAIALLSLILFVDILRDVIQQITGRRKRDVEEENDVFAFIHNGGLGALKEGLPSVVLPLLVDLVEATEAPHCLQRPLCDANAELSLKYGVVGRVFSSLLSNVVSKAFSWDDNKRFHMALQAASAGRSTHDCAKFPRCSAAHKYSQDVNNNNSATEGSNVLGQTDEASVLSQNILKTLDSNGID